MNKNTYILNLLLSFFIIKQFIKIMDFSNLFLIGLLYLISYCIITHFTEFKDINKLLASPKNYFYGKEKISSIDIDDKLLIATKEILLDNNILTNNILLSLSGSVDSMVVLAILLKLKTVIPFNIIVVMINYNLRKESKDEAMFIAKYCDAYNIECNILDIPKTNKDRKNMGASERKKFENNSKELRYHMYKKLTNIHNCVGTLFGHHKDDIIENIFTNSMNGNNLLDLEVIKPVNIIKQVKIIRPLLYFNKTDIYNFAHKYNIPYFLDTTPKWCRRGQMRLEVFPLLDHIFGPSWKTIFKELGTQSNQWSNTINHEIINPWIEKAILTQTSSNKKFIFMLPIEYKNDINLWYYIIPLVFLKKNLNTIKRKTVKKLYLYAIDDSLSNDLILDSGYIASKINNNIIISKE